MSMSALNSRLPTLKSRKGKTLPAEKSARGQIMARIRSKDTRPEKVVRQILFAMGYRFRIHRKDLPGCPDIAFLSRKKAIFVNGCFWHQHPGCARATLPATNQAYWLPKFKRNKQRDDRIIKELAQRHWKVLTIWECKTGKRDELQATLQRFLGSRRYQP